MIIENGNAKFTEEEKKNLTVREYTNQEIKQNKKAYIQKANKKCVPLIAIIIICYILSFILPDMSYAIDIAMGLLIFFFILMVVINILNYRIAKRSHYIEIFVDRKIPIETECRDAGASDDSYMIYHYPVEGRDSTSGYASIFYVGKEKYENIEVGEKIRINIDYYGYK